MLDGVPLYRAALQTCEYGLASTEILAEAMREAGTRRAFVVHNALDRETIACAERLLQRRLRREIGDAVANFYGSGSKSHDGDFLCASRALAKLMRQRCNVRLRVVGDLTLSREFDALEDRIERLPFTDYPTYLRLMSETDITIAPLSTGLFNDGKSNIKFLESAVLAIPSVCSPRAEFRRAIADGETGYLADSEEDWLSALLQLADNAELRRTVGAAARKAALSGFEHSVIAHAEVAPLLAHFGEPPSRKLRVLEVNIYFAPRRFGGATIVAEEVSRQLHDRDDTEVFVFTSCDLPQLRPYELTRYEADGIPVLAVRLPSFDSRDLEFDNAHMQKVFAEVLLTVRPNVVHFHAIQGLTVSMADACVAAGTPYVITLHDAWWLCERQFMVRGDGRYCFQRKVDWKVCASCVPDLGFSLGRSNRLRTVLERSALLLAPSEHQRQLYAANELDCDHIVVNKNRDSPTGPERGAQPEREDPVRFRRRTWPAQGIDLHPPRVRGSRRDQL